jgi:hypothetical protein
MHACPQASFSKELESSRKRWDSTLTEAVRALKKSKALKRLRAVLVELLVAERFELTSAPPALPLVGSELIKQLGIPAGPQQQHSALSRLRHAWDAHERLWTKPVVPPSPRETFAYWRALSATAPELAQVAMLHLSRPVSSASAERVGSLLSQLDVPGRRGMSVSTLHNVLFLRANSHIMRDLRNDLADSMVVTAASAERREERSKQLRDAVAAAATTLQASIAARAAAAAAAAAAKRAAAVAAAAAAADAGEAAMDFDDDE